MNHSPVTLLLAVVALLALNRCDTSFEAFEDAGQTYSVFGFLDAHADTQFVRVEPVQDSTFAGSPTDAPLDARVTTENAATGETVVWTDRVDHVGANGVPVHNFTTTAKLEPEATYRFRVERASDGASASAEVTLPPAFPVPEVINPPDFRPGSEPSEEPTLVRVEGVERLGGVQARYDYVSCITPPGADPLCRRKQTTVLHLSGAVQRDNGTIEIEVPWQSDIPEASSAVLDTLISFRVTVASVSEDWPVYDEGNPPGGGPEGQPLPPPSINTNIEGGTGFLGGAFTRTVDVPILGT